MIEYNYYLGKRLLFVDLESILIKSKYKCRIIGPRPYCLNLAYIYNGAKPESLEKKVFYVIHVYNYGRMTFWYLAMQNNKNDNLFNFWIAYAWDRTGYSWTVSLYPLFYDHTLKDFYFILTDNWMSEYWPMTGTKVNLPEARTTLEEGFNLVQDYSLMTVRDALLYPIRNSLLVTERNLDLPWIDQLLECEDESWLKFGPSIQWYKK